jgi:hypothetical protein
MDDHLEEDGKFTPAFSSDMKKVYLVLYSLFGATSAWQHVKKYQQAQAGRKAWRVLHAHFFGGDKATSLYQQTLKRLGDLKFDGTSNPKTWSFDKYTTAHVSAHNTLHTLHVDYGVEPFNETMKIKYFQDGISDKLFHPVQLQIHANPSQFTTFDQVKELYTTFKRTTSAFDNPGTTRRGISSFGRGGHGRGRGGGGRGRSDHTPRKPTQEEIDACTHIIAKRFDVSDYKRFSAAERAKLYQLMHPNKTTRGMDRPRGGDRAPADGCDRKGPSSTVSEASAKRPKVEESDNEELWRPTSDEESVASTNRKNKALTRSSPSGRQKKSDE